LRDGARIGVAIIAVLGLIFGISLLVMVWERHTRPYQEETRRLTYEQSQTHQDAVAIDLTDLCRQYRAATDSDVKNGLAETIRLHAEHAHGDLPTKTQECVDELL
jgi:hypothetical protein